MIDSLFEAVLGFQLQNGLVKDSYILYLLIIKAFNWISNFTYLMVM